MSRIIFNLAAKCDAAGRSQNQDNYWVCPDLTRWNAPTDKVLGTDEDVELSEKGALLVVADGMGGMNAGEVASKLVIDGIKKKFSDIPDSLLTNEAEIMKFIHNAIVESDESIKKYAKEHKDAEGLGSTIVLLWVLNGRAFCGWCGDSRIYRFNPNNDLVRLSHDHSYVQSLVDEGKITEEEAFDHPDGNIILKALGDSGNKAEPEIRVYDVYSRDVFLLCSDGLCGLLQDTEISDVIQDTCTSSKDSLDALWKKGEKVGWSDNATIELLCIVGGGKPAKGRPDGYPKIARKPVERKDGSNKAQIVSESENVFAKILKPPYLYVIVLLVFCILGIALHYTFDSKDNDENTNLEFKVDNTENNITNIDSNNNTPENSSDNNNNQEGRNISNSGGGRSDGGSKQNAGQGGSSTNGKKQNNHDNQNRLHSNGNKHNDTQTNPEDVEMFNLENPSKDFMNAYDKVKNKFGSANTALQRVNRRNPYITSEDEAVMRGYCQTYKNSVKYFNHNSRDYKVADDGKKEDVDNFERLYYDIENILYEWEKFKNQDQIRQQDNEQERPNNVGYSFEKI